MERLLQIALRSLLVASGLVAISASVMAEQLMLSGRGFFISNNESRLLPNGDTLALVRNQVMAKATNDGVGVLEGGCVGLGRHAPEDERFGGMAFCTLTAENGEDAIVMEIVEPEEDIVAATIVGGAGQWENVTGDGEFRTIARRGNRGLFEFDLNLQTP